LSSDVLLTGPPEAARNKKEEKVRTKFAILLAIAAVCVTTAWAGWANEEQITANRLDNSTRLPGGHRMVISSNGVRHLVWPNGSVYYKRYYPSTGWTRDTMIKAGTFPSIALDADGTTIHVVWQSEVGSGKNKGWHIFYQKCVPGSSGNGGWVGTPKDLTPNAGTHWYYSPVVACYQGHVTVAWYAYDYPTIGFCEWVDGSWGTPRYFDAPVGAGNYPWWLSMAVDSQNRFGDAFIWFNVANLGSYVIRRQGAAWQAPEAVTADAYMGSMEVDPSTGHPHLVCSSHGDSHIYHTYWDPAGGWQPLEMISDPSVPLWPTPAAPNMFFSGGSAFVVWAESISASQRGIRYSIGQYGNWTAPVWVTYGHHGEFPSVAASSAGDVYVVWTDRRDARYPQIWGRLYTPGSGGGQVEAITTPQSGIELFPNPAKVGRVTVQYSLPRAEPVRVTLLDVSGRAVRTQEIPAAERSGSVSIDVSGLNAGVYVARLVAGDLSVSKSLVVER
jgi:hypothetical protein